MTVYYQPGYRPNDCKDERRHDCDCRCHRHECDCHRHDCDCHRHDCDCRSPIDCKPEKVAFKCNNLSGASGISVIALGDTVTPRNIGSISVPELCCFKKPCVKIDVSAIVSFAAAIAVGTTITFRIFKRCGRSEEIEVQSFDLTQGLAIAAGGSIPVNFSVCDCDGCHSDCCTYRVTVEATAAVAVASAINVNQGTISIIAGDVC
ncbi:MAG: DUF4489 domain-containing protein [Tissierellaceae bacterium]